MAVSASKAVSALARTPMVRISSTQPIRRPKSPVSFGWMVGTSPSMTSPALPSMVITSPSFSTLPRDVRDFALMSTNSSLAPATHGVPMPRATTAA